MGFGIHIKDNKRMSVNTRLYNIAFGMKYNEAFFADGYNLDDHTFLIMLRPIIPKTIILFLSIMFLTVNALFAWTAFYYLGLVFLGLYFTLWNEYFYYLVIKFSLWYKEGDKIEYISPSETVERLIEWHK